MKINVKAMKTLLKAKRVTVDDLKIAVLKDIITAEEFKQITGKEYA
jgi:hypothetical protein